MILNMAEHFGRRHKKERQKKIMHFAHCIFKTGILFISCAFFIIERHTFSRCLKTAVNYNGNQPILRSDQ